MSTVRPGSSGNCRQIGSPSSLSEMQRLTGGLDVPRDRHLGGISISSSSNLDLGAGDVPLGRAGKVKAGLTNANSELKDEVYMTKNRRTASIRTRYCLKQASFRLSNVRHEKEGAYLARRDTRRDGCGELISIVGLETERVEASAPLCDL